MRNDLLRILVLLAVLTGFAGSASALPSLQLGPGPVGSWTYDTSTQTWVTDDPGFELNAYANDDVFGRGAYAWDAPGTNQVAYLVVSAVPHTDLDAFDITISNDGAALAIFQSGTGTPPVTDPKGISPHSIFDTYYEIYEFEFDGPLTGIIDTQSGGGSSAKGYIETFDITINSLVPGQYAVHFDLYTLKSNGTDLKAVAPYSHDAQASPIPEPSAALVFGIGTWVMQRRVRRGSARSRSGAHASSAR